MHKGSMASDNPTVRNQEPSAFSILITTLEDPRHSTLHDKKQSSLKRGSTETPVNSTSRKKDRREIPQPPRTHAKRRQDTSKQGAGSVRKPLSSVSPVLVDAANQSGLSSTRKETIMERGVTSSVARRVSWSGRWRSRRLNIELTRSSSLARLYPVAF